MRSADRRRPSTRLVRQARQSDFVAKLEDEFEAGKSYKANKADWFAGRVAGLCRAAEPITERRAAASGVTREVAVRLIGDADHGPRRPGRPQDAQPHPRCQAWHVHKSGQGFDWATAEASRSAPCCSEGYAVRLSGQDSAAARSASATPSGSTRPTSTNISRSTSPDRRFEVLDSPLSEFGVLGFEYGYAGPRRRRSCCGKRSSAISPTARRS
jgi:2-oxoglutarate dehydrogenase E1 component